LIELFNDRNFSFLKGNRWLKNFPKPYLMESIFSLRFFTTFLFANDKITNDIPVTQRSGIPGHTVDLYFLLSNKT